MSTANMQRRPHRLSSPGSCQHLLVVVLLLLPGCGEGVHYKGPYPAGWPLAELKLPAGARKIQLMDQGHGNWLVSFKAPGNVMTVVDNTAVALQDAGWLSETSSGERSMGSYGRELLQPVSGARVRLDSRVVPGSSRKVTSSINEYVFTLMLPDAKPAGP